MSEPAMSAEPVQIDAWKWWESRRLGYNLALAAAGWGAYGLHLALRYAFGWPQWMNWSRVVSQALYFGSGFLFVMFAANIFYLLGMLVEGWLKPTDRDAFRRHTFALGLWTSVALPFVFPLTTLARLVAGPEAFWY